MSVRHDPAVDYIDVPTEEVLTPDYFAVLGTRVLRGRTFAPEEFPPPGSNASHAVILSASLAMRLFGTLDVIGRTVERPVYRQPPRTSTIVGHTEGAVTHTSSFRGCQ